MLGTSCLHYIVTELELVLANTIVCNTCSCISPNDDNF